MELTSRAPKVRNWKKFWQGGGSGWICPTSAKTLVELRSVAVLLLSANHFIDIYRDFPHPGYFLPKARSMPSALTSLLTSLGYLDISFSNPVNLALTMLWNLDRMVLGVVSSLKHLLSEIHTSYYASRVL